MRVRQNTQAKLGSSSLVLLCLVFRAIVTSVFKNAHKLRKNTTTAQILTTPIRWKNFHQETVWFFSETKHVLLFHLPGKKLNLKPVLVPENERLIIQWVKEGRRLLYAKNCIRLTDPYVFTSVINKNVHKTNTCTYHTHKPLVILPTCAANKWNLSSNLTWRIYTSSEEVPLGLKN